MISTAQEDERPTAPTTPVAHGVPTARRALENGLVADPARLRSTRLDTAPPAAVRVGGVSGPHVDRVVAELESSATVTWALRLALLGAIGLIVLLVTVL